MADESLRVTEGMAAGTAIELGDEFVIGRAMVGEGRLGRGSGALPAPRSNRQTGR